MEEAKSDVLVTRIPALVPALIAGGGTAASSSLRRDTETSGEDGAENSEFTASLSGRTCLGDGERGLSTAFPFPFVDVIESHS